MNINVNNKTFEQHDYENINWISHLTYLDPNADIRDCTAQGKSNRKKSLFEFIEIN